MSELNVRAYSHLGVHYNTQCSRSQPPQCKYKGNDTIWQ